ncbi:hypothetical protein GVAV_000813 [Gurleya vavrai]
MSNVYIEQKKLITEKFTLCNLIKNYFYVYDLQKSTPYKIFFECLPQSDNFEINLLEELYNWIQETERNFLGVFNKMVDFDDFLKFVDSYDFIDIDIYNICQKVFQKCILLYIDHVECLILSEKDFDFVLVYKALNFFVKEEFDFTNICISKFQKKFDQPYYNFKEIYIFLENQRYYFYEYQRILKINKRSILIDDNYFQSKIQLSKLIKNEEKNAPCFNDFILNFNVNLKKFFEVFEPETAYLKILDYCSELVSQGIIYDIKVLDDLKNFANELILNSKCKLNNKQN